MILTKRRKLFFRAVSWMLVAVMLMTGMSAMALEEKAVADSRDLTAEKWNPQEELGKQPNTKGDLTSEQLETAELAVMDIPDVITDSAIEENEHVHRLYEQEDADNTVVFQNRDGTKTKYLFSYPIKYKDDDGSFKDKKNNLVSVSESAKKATYQYENQANDVKTYFPHSLKHDTGVLLEKDAIRLELIPAPQLMETEKNQASLGGETSTALSSAVEKSTYVNDIRKNSSAAIYSDVFGSGTHIRYTPQYDGVKEDIILDRYTGISEFTFTIKTNGYSLIEDDLGNVYIADPLTGEAKATIDPVYLYDSYQDADGNPHATTENGMAITAVVPDQEYRYTIYADQAFLMDDSTVYPVYVDPTMRVMGEGDVENAAIYSKQNRSGLADTEREIKVGYNSATYGYGRGLFDLPIMEWNSDFIFLYGNQIKSARLVLWCLPYGTGNPTFDNAKPLSLYEFKSSWSPGTVKWNNTSPNNYNGSYLSKVNVTSRETRFDISSVVSRMKTDPDYTMAFKGLLLKADCEDTSVWKKFVSSNGSIVSQRPYVEITYNDSPPACPQVESGKTYFIRNYSGKYLDVYGGGTADNTRLWQYGFNSSKAQIFKITNTSGGEYKIEPQNASGKVLSVNSSNQVIIEQDCSLSKQRWHIFYRNGGYHFVNKQNNTTIMEATYDSNYVYTSNNYNCCC